MKSKIKSLSKYTAVFLAGAITATAGSAYAADAIKTIQAKLRPDIKVSVNGKQLDASAISYNNTTYLPLRKAADAVGGKLELDGKNVNIVTEGKSNPALNPTVSTPTPTVENNQNSTSETGLGFPIEDKVLFRWNDINAKLNELDKSTMIGGTINNELVVKYNGKDYVRINNIDYYYDAQNNVNYLSIDFLTKFLDASDLEELSKFRVNVTSKVIIPI